MTPEEREAWEKITKRLEPPEPPKRTKQEEEDAAMFGLGCLVAIALGVLALLTVLVLLAYKFLTWLIP